MKLINSGAGSGKTTSLAKVILSREAEASKKSHVFVIAYSNYAADVIKGRLINVDTINSTNIHFSTIHSFLWNYVIEPYYYLLFGIQFNSVSNSKLSGNSKYRTAKLAQMRADGILHVSEFSRVAKQVVRGRKRVTKNEKNLRALILCHLSVFIHSIYIDEAQDMDQDTADILEVLDYEGVFCYLVGDVNQDLHARNGFSTLIENHQQDLELMTENYRCPQIHVNVSNGYIPYDQVSMSAISGKLSYVLEKNCNVIQLADEFRDGLIYIHKSLRSFQVHKRDDTNLMEQLEYVLRKYHVIIPEYSDLNSEASKKWAFDLAHLVFKAVQTHEKSKNIVHKLMIELHQSYSSKLYAELIEGVEALTSPEQKTYNFPLYSIEAVKGNQANRCLFIMSTDLFRVLIGENKKVNSTTNLLYVGLTRSTETLVIMLTNEVTDHYTDEEIQQAMTQLGINKVVE